ncbi:leucine-rich repeat domain-containing protein [Noviherbaspirillum sp.]|uniref:leucine-rich repeat domain-containing protein n=1 Tax=Noviherbaspirillum sp. TaxID=1926288 RepID=UPI0039C8FEDF
MANPYSGRSGDFILLQYLAMAIAISALTYSRFQDVNHEIFCQSEAIMFRNLLHLGQRSQNTQAGQFPGSHQPAIEPVTTPLRASQDKYQRRVLGMNMPETINRHHFLNQLEKDWKTIKEDREAFPRDMLSDLLKFNWTSLITAYRHDIPVAWLARYAPDSRQDWQGSLTRLQVLDLSGNQLSTVPRGIEYLAEFRELNFNGNRLTSLPPKIGDLKQLRRLTLWRKHLTTCANDHPDIDKAREVATEMFKKAFGLKKASFNDFHYSPGHVLSYVMLHIERVRDSAPAERQDEVFNKGIRLLTDHLAFAHDSCDTRQIEEVMMAVSIPFDADEKSTQGTIIPITPLPEHTRDAVYGEAKKALPKLLAAYPDLRDDDKQLQNAFRLHLKELVQAEHKNIPVWQTAAYIDSLKAQGRNMVC